jgi:hypothetical protein
VGVLVVGAVVGSASAVEACGSVGCVAGVDSSCVSLELRARLNACRWMSYVVRVGHCYVSACGVVDGHFCCRVRRDAVRDGLRVCLRDLRRGLRHDCSVCLGTWACALEALRRIVALCRRECCWCGD